MLKKLYGIDSLPSLQTLALKPDPEKLPPRLVSSLLSDFTLQRRLFAPYESQRTLASQRRFPRFCSCLAPCNSTGPPWRLRWMGRTPDAKLATRYVRGSYPRPEYSTSCRRLCSAPHRSRAAAIRRSGRRSVPYGAAEGPGSGAETSVRCNRERWREADLGFRLGDARVKNVQRCLSLSLIRRASR
jgi:hypothetical protein